MKDIPVPWAVTAILAVLIIVGVVIWRSRSSGPPVPTGPTNPYQEYRGAPPGGPPGAAR